MSDLERRYHETWLGMAQPIEGLVVSVPVLVDAQCMQRLPLAEQHKLIALTGEKKPQVLDVPRFLREVLGYPDGAFTTEVPPDLKLDVVEGQQTVVPTRALKRRGPPPQKPEGLPDDSTPTSRAAEGFVMLTWEVPAGLDLDKKESVTGKWFYEPTLKLERLLRAARVPIGLLFNGDSVRLIYVPHGESTGHLTFRFADLVTASGRPLFDAMMMLLSARRLFGVLPEHQLPALLEQSRRRQANVTEALAEQVFEALTILLAGFEAAAERDGSKALDDAFERGEDHVYGGLLSTLLRLVFVLYAEDRGLMPVDHEPYTDDLSVKALYEQLLEDAGRYPDAMSRRFGAWPRLLALFRCIFFGASHGKLVMPPRRGQLFDPEAFPFLEGWSAGGAPVEAAARAATKPPSVDDETIYRVLERLIVLEGQRLSYQALDVEQIGSVYEALMGYHVKRLTGAGLCLKGSKVWVSADEVLEQPAARRSAWLGDEGAVETKAVKALSKTLAEARSEEAVLAALEPHRVKSIDARKPGQLVLQPGPERRRTSSHYTPRSLSAPIVRRALEPLLKAMGDLPSSQRLLNLKICDPAMGSGAFLVEACRYLADQVVAAWTREGALATTRKDDDIVMRARRLVAQRCLYGVDKNPWAVNLAKLSLWLVTLAREEPFTFLDHALKCGDSLVGLDLSQIRAFHWKPKEQTELAERAFEKALALGLQKRQQILQMALDLEGPAAAKAPKQLGLDASKRKEELLRDANDALFPLKRVADACVGAFFAAESDKEREKERVRRRDILMRWLAAHEGAELPVMPPDVRELSAPPHAFHWPLEFPEIFHGKRPDPLDADQTSAAAWMDAFVGNPPFAGKNGIIEAGGECYLPWLQVVHENAHGNADLSAHFFRRAFHLLGLHGTIGFIATNTVAQGDTRTTGLKFIVDHGGELYDAVRSMKWPVPGANVAVSVVHVAKGHVSKTALEPRLDGARVQHLSSRLRANVERPDPVALAANAGKSFQGSIVLGMGFVLTPQQRVELIAKNSRNGERIFRYVGGEELTADPDPRLERYVINFAQMDLSDAERWPDLLKIVRTLVKPEREENKRESYRKWWWHFGEKRVELYEALRPLRRCLAIPQVSKHLLFAWRQTADTVFAHMAYVISLEEDRALALLQSRLHRAWVRLTASTLEDRQGYRPSDCFETFPFPPSPTFASLDTIGAQLDAARKAFISANGIGLTTTYNRLKDESITDPAVQHLRELHEAVDRAVLDTYGWTDIKVPPYCGASAAELEQFEDAVLDRLFELNAQRAKEEALISAKVAPKKARSSAKARSRS